MILTHATSFFGLLHSVATIVSFKASPPSKHYPSLMRSGSTSLQGAVRRSWPKKRAGSITPLAVLLIPLLGCCSGRSHQYYVSHLSCSLPRPPVLCGRLYALLLAYAYPRCSDASPRSPRRQRGEPPPRCKSKGATRRRRPGCRRPRCSWRSSTGRTRNPARLKPRRLRRERHLG